MNTVLIEAHPLVRTGIAHLLRTLKGVTGVTVVEPDDGMFDAIEANADAGLLVIGLPLPHLDELSAIGEIMHRPHARHVVVLAESESPDIIRTLMQMGLSGYTVKHSPGEVIAASLELVLVGGQYIPASALLPESRLDGTPNPALAGDPQTDPKLLGITPRQYEILVLLSRGHPVKTISRMLNISEATAKAHISTLYRRLKVRSRTEAVYVANQRGVWRATPSPTRIGRTRSLACPFCWIGPRPTWCACVKQPRSSSPRRNSPPPTTCRSPTTW